MDRTIRLCLTLQTKEGAHTGAPLQRIEDGRRQMGSSGRIKGSNVLLQRSSAEHFVFAEGLKGGGRDGGDGNGVADGVKDLDGVPLRAVRGGVVVHQLDDVAATETMLRQVARQRRISV